MVLKLCEDKQDIFNLVVHMNPRLSFSFYSGTIIFDQFNHHHFTTIFHSNTQQSFSKSDTYV